MIDVIKQQLKDEMLPLEKVNVVREFLQILCLKIMDDKKMFDHLAFFGGTALRILYDLRRYSEDLDFSVTQKEEFNINDTRNELIKSLQLYGLNVEAKSRSVGAVESMMIKFTGLLKDLDLSPLASQKLSIKWETDTNPPSGADITNTIVNKHFIFNVTHYDLPSLFAGKLHACFYRKYIKGRDWYDFVWYVSKKIKPNFSLLNNAIVQTQKESLNIQEENFKQHLLKNVERIDFMAVQKDVREFLVDERELDFLEKNTIQGLIESVY